jgi:hypothetical protein
MRTEKINIKPFYIDDTEATFIYRALLNCKGRIDDILKLEGITQNMDNNSFIDSVKKVGLYQDEIISGLMDELTEQFNTDINLMLPK